jgi:glycosyltransferase involved in cell wall biosynthesis
VPVVEAQSLGLPLVARDVPGVRETAGDSQLLVGGDPAEIAEAVAMLEGNPAYRRALVEAGADNYERRFRRAEIERRFREALGIVVDAGG